VALAALALSLALGGCGGGAASTTTTPPASPAIAGPTLVAAGDIACTQNEPQTPVMCHQAETAALAKQLDPDAVAVLGDLQYSPGGPGDSEGTFDPTWGRLKDRMHPAIGNHEYETPGATPYFDYFGERAGAVGEAWYSYELGDWHVVVLNANCEMVACDAGSPQQRWLREDLARHASRCTLAYWHQPRFSSGPHGSDEALAPLWLTLQRAGAEVVLSGHDHDYERFAPQTADGRRDAAHGIVQFVAGTGGKSHYPIVAAQPNSRARASTFGVLALTLGADRYAWRFVGERGERFHDAGTARCH
jgi:hypothetical protein